MYMPPMRREPYRIPAQGWVYPDHHDDANPWNHLNGIRPHLQSECESLMMMQMGMMGMKENQGMMMRLGL